MNSGEKQHIPVLLDAVLEKLDVRADGVYVDGTFGRGGHSRALLDRLGPDGRLVVIDRDYFKVSEEEMLLISAELTLIDGKIVYKKE